MILKERIIYITSLYYLFLESYTFMLDVKAKADMICLKNAFPNKNVLF